MDLGDQGPLALFGGRLRDRLPAGDALSALVAFCMCACAQQNTPSQPSGQLKTVSDVFSAKGSDSVWTYDESHFVCAFCSNGTYMRVTADLPDGMKDKLDATKYDEAKVKELIGSLPIAKSEVLADTTTIQKELDSLKGKTGAEIVEAGYMIGEFSVGGNETRCSAEKGALTYQIFFEGAAANPNATDRADAVKDLKVKSASVKGVSFGALGLGDR